MTENKRLLKQGSALLFMALMASVLDVPLADNINTPANDTGILHQEPPKQLLGANYRLLGCSERAQQIYAQAIANEPAITRDMIAIRNKLDIDFYGLGNTLKQAASVLAKIERLAEQDKNTGLPVKPDYEYLSQLGDLVRYTFMCEHTTLATTTKAIIGELMDKSYRIDEVDNKYLRQDILYKAIHINATAPNGQKMEIQLHSPESMRLNVFTHKTYEQLRSAETSELDKQLLKEKIRLAYCTLPMPKDIEKIKNV